MIRTSSDSLSNTSTEFGEEILHGLKQSPKILPSKYFYNEIGDKLFQQIMALPEYYLTNCEFDVLTNQAESIMATILSKKCPFNIVELGAGDGTKTKVVLKYLSSLKVPFTYVPVDISAHVLEILEEHMKNDIPDLKIKKVAKTYNDALASPDWDQTVPTLMMFLGSSLGNFPLADSPEMIKRIGQSMRTGDQLLIGLDLQKDPEIILAAYNDSKGVTSDFNLNLLDRINKEMGANFNRDKFKHFPTYDPEQGAAKSYIVSKEHQEVYFKELDKTIIFESGEAIFTEISQKYKLSDIKHMAESNNFRVIEHFYDQKRYYVNSLWEKI